MTTSLLDESVGRLARTIPGATRLFHEYQIDFCCGGKHSLRAALAEQGVADAPLLAELALLQQRPLAAERDWSAVAPPTLIDHILERYHAVHRQQFPELIRLARRVEQVHAEHPACPMLVGKFAFVETYSETDVLQAASASSVSDILERTT